jgi:hypothetical protein
MIDGGGGSSDADAIRALFAGNIFALAGGDWIWPKIWTKDNGHGAAHDICAVPLEFTAGAAR